MNNKTTLTQQQAELLWDFLLENGVRESMKGEFMNYFTEDDGWNLKEFRCFSKLGFGGKLKLDSSGRLYASMYSEDSNQEREYILKKLNRELAELAASLYT